MFGLFKKKKGSPNKKQDHPSHASPSAPQASPDSTIRRPSFGSMLGGALSTATAVGKFSLSTAASVGNTVAVKAKKVGKKTGLAVKDGIIDASLFVDKHAKHTIDYLQDKTTEGSTCNLGLSQLNVFRRQAKEGVVYTMNLPQNASRDMRVFQLLPHGRPWPCVTNIIEGHIDDNTDKENWQAIKWLCKALDTAHVADGIKNTAIELLSVKDFTNYLETRQYAPAHTVEKFSGSRLKNLNSMVGAFQREPHNLYDPLMDHCVKSLNKIGRRLNEYYNDEQLSKKLGSPNLPLHPAVIAEQEVYIERVAATGKVPSTEWYVLLLKEMQPSSSSKEVKYVQDLPDEDGPNMGNRAPVQCSLKELAAWVNNGTVTKDTFVWHQCLAADQANATKTSSPENVSMYVAMSKVPRLMSTLKQFPFFLKRQDSPALNSCTPDPNHAAGYPYFEEESIYIHVLRLTALAIDQSYQEIIQDIAETAAKNTTDYTFSKASIKGDARIRNKACSQDDHANDPRPRPAQNIDVNRNCLTFDTPEELLDCATTICNHDRFGNGAARIKNGFAAPIKQAKKAFHYRTLMLNLVFDAGKTYEELASDPTVQQMWEDYVDAPPENPRQPWCTWRDHAQKALAHLKSDGMKHRNVKLLVETQLLLKEYKLGRDEMHLLYKVVRTDSDKALFRQFVGNANSMKAAKSNAKWSDHHEALHAKLLVQLQAHDPSNSDFVAHLLRNACVEGAHLSVAALLQTKGMIDNPAAINAVGNVERADVQKSAAIQSHTMHMVWGFLGLPNAGKCFNCHKMGVNRICVMCHLCSNCASEQECVPCTGVCRWCVNEHNETSASTYPTPKGHEHTCCQPSKIQFCFCRAPEKYPKYLSPGLRLPGKTKTGNKEEHQEESGEEKKEPNNKHQEHDTVHEEKLSIYQKDDRTKSALYLACEEGHATVVQSLLNVKNINVNHIASFDGTTPLIVSVNGGHEPVVRLLLAMAQIDINYNSIAHHNAELKGMSALIVAAHFGHEGIVRMLVNHQKIEVDKPTNATIIRNSTADAKIKTALTVACERGHLGIVRLLLEKGANIDLSSITSPIQDVEVVFPIFACCSNGHDEILKVLLSQLSSPEELQWMNAPSTKLNRTPLVAACMYGFETVAEILLDYKGIIDVHVQCKNDEKGKGLTAIIAASKIGNVPIVSKLLQVVDVTEYSKLFEAKDFQGRYCLRACIIASRKGFANKLFKIVRATSVKSKGSKPDRPKVQKMLRAAIARIPNQAEANTLLAEADKEEEEKALGDKEEADMEKILQEDEAAEELEAFKERKKNVEDETETLNALLPVEEKEKE